MAPEFQPPKPDGQTPADAAAEPLGTRVRQLARLFLRLGTISFGGPAAHTAIMQQEVVVRRQWLTGTEFLDMLAATNFIPGPNSTEMVIHIGYRRAGWRGLIVAGTCFILPAAIMCTIIAAIYVTCGQWPISRAILWGVKPVVIAVVGQALFRLARSALKTWMLAALAVVAAGALLASVNELGVLFGTGAVAAVVGTWHRRQAVTVPLLAWPLGQTLPAVGGAAATAAAAATVSAPLGSLFLIFLKIGSVLFGSGYVLLAFLRADFVEQRHWLTESTLLDAVAVGQVTPGPVFTTATFIGYVMGGPLGAVAATVGIFLPAFFFVAASAPLLPRLRKSAFFGAFLDGLNAASLALMAVVLLQLAYDALRVPGVQGYRVDYVAVAVTLVSLGLLIWRNANSAWLVLAGAALGAVHARLA
jgi:chromate transporter